MVPEPTSDDPLDWTVGIAEPKAAGQIHVLLRGEAFVEEAQGSVVFRADEAVDNPPGLV
jgi:hypothetical protein